MNKTLKRILLGLYILLIILFLLFKLIFTQSYQEPTLNYNLISFDYYGELTKKINKQILSMATEPRSILKGESLINNAVDKELINANHFESEFTKFNTIKIDHLWIEINSDYLNSYGNLNLNNRHFSGIKVNFTITTDNDNIYLHLNSMKLGKLPIIPIFSFSLLKNIFIHLLK